MSSTDHPPIANSTSKPDGGGGGGRHFSGTFIVLTTVIIILGVSAAISSVRKIRRFFIDWRSRQERRAADQENNHELQTFGPNGPTVVETE